MENVCGSMEQSLGLWKTALCWRKTCLDLWKVPRSVENVLRSQIYSDNGGHEIAIYFTIQHVHNSHRYNNFNVANVS